MKTTRNLLITGMVAAFCCSVASAQITMVYSNDFNVGGLAGNTTINAVAPTYVDPNAALFGGDTGATWDVVSNNFSAGYYFNQNGTFGPHPNSLLLPLTPLNGYIYTLSATFTFSADPGNWIGMGFAQFLPPSNNFNPAQGDRMDDPAVKGNPWALFRPGSANGGSNLAPTRNSNAGNVPNLISTNYPNSNSAQLILDTRDSANWAASLYVNGTFVASYVYTNGVNMAPLQSVGFTWTATANTAFNTFLLTAQVPEPSTPALIGLGGAMLLLVTLYRSRRNAVRIR